jgi:endoglucanase
LAKGINLSNWFNEYSSASEYANRFSTAQLSLIKNSGFTYVRLPIGVNILFNEANPSQLNQANLALVDQAINNCITNGLSVTINLHPWQARTDSLVAKDPAFADKIALYWKAIANHYKSYPYDKIFFEVFNEPHAMAVGFTNASIDYWQPIQEKFVKAIRDVSEAHYIIVGGEKWNSIEGLLALQKYNYKNVVYNFHFYDPFLFTHQGATWIDWVPARDGRNIPYPSSPAAVAPLVAAATNTELKNTLTWYGNQNIGINYIDGLIKPAADWAAAKDVILIANEFGSYKLYAPRTSRLAYLKDTRLTLEKYGIGWAMWEADEGFGFINYGSGRANPTADNEILQALGLK